MLTFKKLYDIVAKKTEGLSKHDLEILMEDISSIEKSLYICKEFYDTSNILYLLKYYLIIFSSPKVHNFYDTDKQFYIRKNQINERDHKILRKKVFLTKLNARRARKLVKDPYFQQIPPSRTEKKINFKFSDSPKYFGFKQKAKYFEGIDTETLNAIALDEISSFSPEAKKHNLGFFNIITPPIPKNLLNREKLKEKTKSKKKKPKEERETIFDLLEWKF